MTIQRSCWRELHHCRTSARIGCRFRVFQPVKIQEGFHEVCAVFHLNAFACLGDFKTQEVDCVAFMAQHHHICQIQNGLLGATVTWKWAWKSELVDALVT